MIPANIIRMAQINAERAHARINIYKHKHTFVVAPDGYNIHDPDSILLGYVTADGNVVERDVESDIERGNDHETTTKRRD